MARRIFKQDEFRETGFGNRVLEYNQRLMNKDGFSNVRRVGLASYSASKIYQQLITMPWWKFLLVVTLSYTTVNLFFAILYYFGDLEHVNGMIFSSPFEKFMEVFFFSSQSLTTVGYGRLNPVGIYDSTLAAIESFVGLLSFAIATGLLYGRFSRPVANIIYSDNIIMAPYHGITALMIRLANKSKSELLEPQATLLMAYVVTKDGNKERKFSNLKLELTKVTLLTLSWTIVHPIDEESPVYRWTEEDFKKNEVEFLLMINAYEETFAQTVHSRTSFRYDELVMGAKFTSIVKPGVNGSVAVELNRINEFEPTPLFESII
jgi:inward rectifier potassium channel